MNSTICLAIVLAGLVAGTTALAADAAKTPPSALAKLLSTPILDKKASHAEMRTYLHSRIPPLELPSGPKQWDARAEDLRQRMLDQVVMRGHDPKVLTDPPAVQWLDTIETGKGYVIRKLRYEGYPGMWIPALLYEPTNLKGKVPVVLNPNGHERAAGKAVKYKQLRCINLAKRGMIALNYEWPAMGELRLPGYDHYELAYLDMCGQAGVGVFYMILKRGLDVLLDHPNADPTRTAVTGLSGGGWQTIFLASLDTRVKLAVPNAGYIGQATRYEFSSDIGDLEQCPVDQLTVADYTHLTAMLAPRPALLIFNEQDNCCFVSERARPSVFEPVVPFYKLYRKAKRFRYHENTDPGNHNYDLDNRQQFYKFASEFLLPVNTRRDKEIASDKEIKTRKQLTVGVPKDNANFHTLSEALAARLPIHPLAECNATAERESWCHERRAALREVLRIEAVNAYLVDSKDVSTSKYAARAMKLEVGNQWHLPAVELAVKGFDPKRVAVVIADGGRVASESLARDLIKDDHRVLAVDVLLTGQCRPVGFSVWQYAMCMGNVGGRPLGMKVTQVLALVDYIAKAHPGRPITIAGVGRVSSVTAVLAAALAEKHRPEMLVTVGLPCSLKLLIEKRVKYTEVPSLFSFGLLREADIGEMLALARPARVKLIKTEGTKQQIAKALAPFAKMPHGAGQGSIDLSQRAYDR